MLKHKPERSLLWNLETHHDHCFFSRWRQRTFFFLIFFLHIYLNSLIKPQFIPFIQVLKHGTHKKTHKMFALLISSSKCRSKVVRGLWPSHSDVDLPWKVVKNVFLCCRINISFTGSKMSNPIPAWPGPWAHQATPSPGVCHGWCGRTWVELSYSAALFLRLLRKHCAIIL